jgi:hypothetical protein
MRQNQARESANVDTDSSIGNPISATLKASHRSAAYAPEPSQKSCFRRLPIFPSLQPEGRCIVAGGGIVNGRACVRVSSNHDGERGLIDARLRVS